VNPVLREGNSDRRAPLSVKKYAQKNTSQDEPVVLRFAFQRCIYGWWRFFMAANSLCTVPEAASVRIEFAGADGSVTVLKDKTNLLKDEVIDTAVMNVRALESFFEAQIEAAKKNGTLLSLHLKATMMKVSDPIMFGHAVKVFYRDVFEKHAAVIKELGVNVRNGLGDLYAKIKNLPDAKRAEIEADIQAVYATRPALAMVDSDKGITNLHVPNDIIVDASMPVVIRDGGKNVGVLTASCMTQRP